MSRCRTRGLVLSFAVPLAIVGGYAVQKLDGWGRADSWGRGGRIPALVVAVAAVAVCAYQSVVVNFRQYDNDQYQYVYSHTYRQELDIVKEHEHAGEHA